jgi:hypothetical protein
LCIAETKIFKRRNKAEKTEEMDEAEKAGEERKQEEKSEYRILIIEV